MDCCEESKQQFILDSGTKRAEAGLKKTAYARMVLEWIAVRKANSNSFWIAAQKGQKRDLKWEVVKIGTGEEIK